MNNHVCTEIMSDEITPVFVIYSLFALLRDLECVALADMCPSYEWEYTVCS